MRTILLVQLGSVLGVYLAGVGLTMRAVARDRPWRVSPPRHHSRWYIVSGVILNGLAWPVLVVKAARRGW